LSSFSSLFSSNFSLSFHVIISEEGILCLKGKKGKKREEKGIRKESEMV
jgi:hypothetical protein